MNTFYHDFIPLFSTRNYTFLPCLLHSRKRFDPAKICVYLTPRAHCLFHLHLKFCISRYSVWNSLMLKVLLITFIFTLHFDWLLKVQHPTLVSIEGFIHQCQFHIPLLIDNLTSHMISHDTNGVFTSINSKCEFHTRNAVAKKQRSPNWDNAETRSFIKGKQIEHVADWSGRSQASPPERQ